MKNNYVTAMICICLLTLTQANHNKTTDVTTEIPQPPVIGTTTIIYLAIAIATILSCMIGLGFYTQWFQTKCRQCFFSNNNNSNDKIKKLLPDHDPDNLSPSQYAYGSLPDEKVISTYEEHKDNKEHFSEDDSDSDYEPFTTNNRLFKV